MKQCPSCGNEYTDAYRFCADDGIELVEVREPQAASQVDDNLIDELLTTPGVIEPSDLAESPDAAKPEPALVGTEKDEGDGETAATQPKPKRWIGKRALFIGSGVLGVIALAILAAFFFTRPSAEERAIIDAAEQGNLVGRGGAAGLYRTFVTSHSAEDATGLRERLIPQVNSLITTFFDSWKATAEASDNEWERMAELALFAVELAPEDAQAAARHSYALGQIAQRDENLPDAEAHYHAAEEAWPDWALPANSLGVVAARRDDFEDAASHYGEAARLDPDWLFPQLNLAGALFNLHRYAELIAPARSVLEKEPDRAYTHYILAVAYGNQRRYREAMSEAETALSMDPGGSTGFEPSRVRDAMQDWRDGAAGIPTEADGQRVYENQLRGGSDMFATGVTDVPIRVTSFRKTDGQRGNVSGVATYTMYYEVALECRAAASSYDVLSQCRRRGQRLSRTGTLTFHRSERGWRGEDGNVYGSPPEVEIVED